MTTKDQERKALEQIKKIVAGLGDNSYVGTAFAGCFSDAEENIENDFALSMQDRWQSAERKLQEAQEESNMLKERCGLLQDRIASGEKSYLTMTNNMQGWMDRANTLQEELNASEQKAEDTKVRISDLENEIVRLKAKLYDAMVAGA